LLEEENKKLQEELIITKEHLNKYTNNTNNTKRYYDKNKKEIIQKVTPLKIYNGTPFGRRNRDLRATLPINELHLCTFKTPPSGAVMSERGDADCTFTT